jgi:hypothetical protein
LQSRPRQCALGRYDDAIADYSVAIDKDAALTRCHFSRGNLYLMLGEYQRAIDREIVWRSRACNLNGEAACTSLFWRDSQLQPRL